MKTSIILVLTLTGIFCLLLTTTIIQLTLAAAYYYYKGSTADDVNMTQTFTSSVVPPMAMALPPVITKTAFDLSLLARNKRYRTPTMPTIPEETLQELLWAATEVPAYQQMKNPPVLLSANGSTSDDSGDAYMIMSGEPPTMPVILEETEEDLVRENFCLMPLTGKHRPPAMPVILEETEEDLEWENFCLMPLTGKHWPPVLPVIPEETEEDMAVALAPLEFPPCSHQHVQPAVLVPVASASTSTTSVICSASLPI
jgi:hypothetical protein